MHCYSHELITAPEESNRIHHSKNSETAIQWGSLYYDHTLKSHPDVKVHINYRLLFCQHNWIF